MHRLRPPVAGPRHPRAARPAPGSPLTSSNDDSGQFLGGVAAVLRCLVASYSLHHVSDNLREAGVLSLSIAAAIARFVRRCPDQRRLRTSIDGARVRAQSRPLVHSPRVDVWHPSVWDGGSTNRGPTRTCTYRSPKRSASSISLPSTSPASAGTRPLVPSRRDGAW